MLERTKGKKITSQSENKLEQIKKSKPKRRKLRHSYIKSKSRKLNFYLNSSTSPSLQTLLKLFVLERPDLQ